MPDEERKSSDVEEPEVEGHKKVADDGEPELQERKRKEYDDPEGSDDDVVGHKK